MVRFIALCGFLGAGKTTTMIAAATQLQQRGRRVAVITNDQGSGLVDTQLARDALGSVSEVTGGCFCCRFEDLLDVANTLIQQRQVQTLLAEAVGSCTDLQATVIRPLGVLYGDQFTVSPLTTVVEADRFREFTRSLALSDRDADVAYLFQKQLEEAEIIAVNKIDLLAEPERESLVAELSRRYPSARVLAYSAATGVGLRDLVDAWLATQASGPNMDVDYERYARAEAMLAWLNRGYQIAADTRFDVAAWCVGVLRYVSAVAAQRGWIIGHAKIGVDSGGDLTKASLTVAGAEPTVDRAAGPASSGTIQVNARVACEPRELDDVIAAAVKTADLACGTSTSAVAPANAFKPGYPRPRYRMAGSTAAA